jgi:hypothetical protein
MFLVGHLPWYIFYYQRFEDQNHWTPWEKVDLDIEGAYDTNCMERRLYLFWAIFTSKDATELNRQLADVEGSLALNHWEINLAWSEYKENKWSPKFTTRNSLLSPIAIKTNDTGYSKTTLYHLPDKRYYFFQALIESEWLEVKCHRTF